MTIALPPEQTSEYVYIPRGLSLEYLEGVVSRALGEDIVSRTTTIADWGSLHGNLRAPDRQGLTCVLEPIGLNVERGCTLLCGD